MNVIKSLEVHSRDISEQRLWGCRIDAPVVGGRTNTYALDIVGWVLGRTLPVMAVEIVSENTVLRRVPLDVPRPDIAAAFSEVSGAERSGFQTTIGLLDGSEQFEYEVRAVLRDDNRVTVGTIRGQRESLRSDFEITDVSSMKVDLSEALWGCHMDLADAGAQTDAYALDIVGWVLGRTLPVMAVEIVSENTVLRRVPLDVPRPDIAAAFSEVSGAERSGFQTTIGLLDGSEQFEYEVRAVLRDDNRVTVGTIRGQRESLRSGFLPKLQPLMVTSLGRTGTTWLMRLLSEHPGIVVHRHYPYELRTAKYWMHVLRVLSEPANHYQSANFDNFHASRWFIGHNPFYGPPVTDDPNLRYWFGRAHVEQLAAFCQRNVEDCYQLVAASQNQPEPVYFAEKHVPDRIPWLTWELYPQAREVILVRDFRDVICSMLAYNSKRGYLAFGRENVTSDEQFVEKVRKSASSLLRSYKQRSSQVYLLRYEDLVLKPADSIKSLLEYLGLDAAASTVESLVRRASAESSDMRQHWTSSEPSQSIGRWRHDMNSSLQVACQETLAEILEDFGYTEDFGVTSGLSEQKHKGAKEDVQ